MTTIFGRVNTNEKENNNNNTNKKKKIDKITCGKKLKTLFGEYLGNDWVYNKIYIHNL